MLLLATSLALTLFVPSLLIVIPASIVSGLLIVRFFVIYHDYQHSAILQRSKLAKIIMTLFGIYILAPESIWKRSHDYHHKHNSKLFSAEIGSFPVASEEKFKAMSGAEKRQYLFIRHPLTILFGYLTMFAYGMCIRSFASSPGKHADSLVALIVHLALSVALFMFFGWQGWLFCIFVPHTVACAIGSYLFYAQHNFPGVYFSCRNNWCYEVAALQSSSYMKMNRVMHWFTANIGYHHIHHLNARIPFYRLPEAMKGIAELQAAKTTSLKPADIAACLKLKIWDAENNRMITLKQMRMKQRSLSSNLG
ncbi:fatty acid desaturase family protein [Foetidibacter luteolus]|uniref:fatty acid desaturase family protein n=1 Tax=Foetidibacter luteolus TaxID=2608880 RepID=UPI001F2529E3|nr:fatty acid desaturase [Foetidibacter luteolus]